MVGSLTYVNPQGKPVKFELGVNGQFQNEDFTIEAKRYEGFDFSRVQINIKPLKKITIKDVHLKSTFKLMDSDQIFCKGYQSWSQAGLYHKNESTPTLKFFAKPFMGQMGDAYLLPKHKNNKQLQSWNYTYVKQENDVLFFAGSCHERSGFTSFIYQSNKQVFKIVKDLENLEIDNNTILFDLFFFDGFQKEAFKQYFEFCELNAKPKEKTAGYTTWYYQFNKIDAPFIRQQLQNFTKHNINFEYFQIDDGWQIAIGDWLHMKQGFNGHVHSLAGDIKKANYKAGLWLAPFICEKKSYFFKHKKDWLLKNENGKPVKAGYSTLWSGWFYALDFYNEEVRSYLKKVFHFVFQEWNFEMVKLDFLYAVSLHPPKNKTKATVLYEAMEWLKEVCGDKEILACGVPLPAAYQIANQCRIGADTHNAWDTNLMRNIGHGEAISSINAIKNTILLSELNDVAFINDPDVVMLRSNNNELNAFEKQSQLYIHYLLGNLFFISDDISQYNHETLKKYKSCFPLKTAENIQYSKTKQLWIIQFEINQSTYHLYFNEGESATQIEKPFRYSFDCKQKNFIQTKVIELQTHQSVCVLKCSSSDVNRVKDLEHLMPEVV